MLTFTFSPFASIASLDVLSSLVQSISRLEFPKTSIIFFILASTIAHFISIAPSQSDFITGKFPQFAQQEGSVFCQYTFKFSHNTNFAQPFI
jgi:hypothetical protein